MKRKKNLRSGCYERGISKVQGGSGGLDLAGMYGPGGVLAGEALGIEGLGSVACEYILGVQ
jgi:hypothetical protein